jgi:urease beta subunit
MILGNLLPPPSDGDSTVVTVGDRSIQTGSHYHFRIPTRPLPLTAELAAGSGSTEPIGLTVTSGLGQIREITLPPLAAVGPFSNLSETL